MNQKLIALLSGLLFGTGLAASGMNDSAVVQGFLDITGDWNPSLMFVMMLALLVSVPGFQFFLRRKPILAVKFNLPSSQYINQQLLVGSAIFGAGWALVGLCPGPAVAALGYLHWEVAIFGLAMLAGAKIRQLQVR